MVPGDGRPGSERPHRQDDRVVYILSLSRRTIHYVTNVTRGEIRARYSASKMVHFEFPNTGRTWAQMWPTWRRPPWLRTTSHARAPGDVYALLEQKNSSLSHGGFIRRDPGLLWRVEHDDFVRPWRKGCKGCCVLTLRTAPGRTVSRARQCGARSTHTRVADPAVAG